MSAYNVDQGTFTFTLSAKSQCCCTTLDLFFILLLSFLHLQNKVILLKDLSELVTAVTLTSGYSVSLKYSKTQENADSRNYRIEIIKPTDVRQKCVRGM